MNQSSTLNQLLQLTYGELSEQEAMNLREQIAQDETLQQEWKNILTTKEELRFSKRAPSDTSVRIILEYSHKTEHIPH